MIAMRALTSSNSRCWLAATLALPLLGGCCGPTRFDREPVRHPVYGAPRHIFADPIGYRYRDIIVHKGPVISQPLLRNRRPNYPIVTPPDTPTGPVGPAPPNGAAGPQPPVDLPVVPQPPAAPRRPTGKTGAAEPASPRVALAQPAGPSVPASSAALTAPIEEGRASLDGRRQ